MFRGVNNIFKALSRLLLCARETQLSHTNENHTSGLDIGDIGDLALLPPQYRLTNEYYNLDQWSQEDHPQSRLVTDGGLDPYRSPSVSIRSLQLDDDECQEFLLESDEQPRTLPQVYTKTCNISESDLSHETHNHERENENDNSGGKTCRVADLIRHFEILQAPKSSPADRNDVFSITGHSITHSVESSSARVRELVALFERDALEARPNGIMSTFAI